MCSRSEGVSNEARDSIRRFVGPPWRWPAGRPGDSPPRGLRAGRRPTTWKAPAARRPRSRGWRRQRHGGSGTGGTASGSGGKIGSRGKTGSGGATGRAARGASGGATARVAARQRRSGQFHRHWPPADPEVHRRLRGRQLHRAAREVAFHRALAPRTPPPTAGRSPATARRSRARAGHRRDRAGVGRLSMDRFVDSGQGQADDPRRARRRLRALEEREQQVLHLPRAAGRQRRPASRFGHGAAHAFRPSGSPVTLPKVRNKDLATPIAASPPAGTR